MRSGAFGARSGSVRARDAAEPRAGARGGHGAVFVAGGVLADVFEGGRGGAAGGGAAVGAG